MRTSIIINTNGEDIIASFTEEGHVRIELNAEFKSVKGLGYVRDELVEDGMDELEAEMLTMKMAKIVFNHEVIEILKTKIRKE